MTMTLRRAVSCFAVIVALVGVLAAQGDMQGDKQYQAALHKEMVDGDLRGAIEEYRAISARPGAARELAATALVRMAECYDKLGDPRAQAVYQQVVREYADHEEAATLARGRLLADATAATPQGDRVVWSGPSLTISPSGRVSPDGRFVTGRRRGEGSLVLHDAIANTDRRLTPPLNPAVYAEHSVFSSDGRRILYGWAEQRSGWRMELRIAPFPPRATLEPSQVLLGNRDDLPRNVTSLDWSPDGKWVAAALRLADGTGQIAMISVSDGSMRVLKSLGWDIPPQLFFSPDSQHLAYDLQARADAAQRDVFVLAADGSRETATVVHEASDNIIGWSPDGRWLLFSSDRTGSWDLWGHRVAAGQTVGSPQLLKSNIGKSFEGRTRSLGVTAAGTLFVHKRVSSRDIVVAPVDLETGKLLGSPTSFSRGMVGGARNAVWSPDGQHLAYPCEDGVCVAVRSVTTGDVRVVRTLSYANTLRWSPDSRSLIATGTDLTGRLGLFQIDVESGAVNRIVPGDDFFLYGFAPEWSPDGTRMYFTRRNAGPLVERDVAAGSEREVAGLTGIGSRNLGPLSPDGRYVTAVRQEAAGTASLLLVPVGGGESRELLRLMQPETFGRRVWTPDGAAVIVEKNVGERSDGTYLPLRRELWLVGLAGGPARKLDIDTSLWTSGAMVPADDGFTLSPDGRRIAFQMGTSIDEVWALDNFLPVEVASR
jgi:Tol biopolymer transport system component